MLKQRFMADPYSFFIDFYLLSAEPENILTMVEPHHEFHCTDVLIVSEY